MKRILMLLLMVSMVLWSIICNSAMNAGFDANAAIKSKPYFDQPIEYASQSTEELNRQIIVQTGKMWVVGIIVLGIFMIIVRLSGSQGAKVCKGHEDSLTGDDD